MATITRKRNPEHPASTEAAQTIKQRKIWELLDEGSRLLGVSNLEGFNPFNQPKVDIDMEAYLAGEIH